MPTLNLGRVGFVNKGVWSGATTYKINDTVTYLGGTYACLIANTGQTPILGGTIYWQEWIANNVVHITGNESIDGIKTFTSSPIVPTPTAGDNTTKVASTAYVVAEIPNQIHSATSKTTPVDADEIPLLDSAATFGLKKLTYGNLKATQKTYNDTLYAPIGSSSISGIRQTVQTASVDASGYPNFLTTSIDLNLPILGTTTPIIINAAGGAISADRLGTISANKTLLLPASSTSYIYESVATNGVCTSGSTTLAPIYQQGGTPAVTNGQFTFNIGEMKGYLGNGTTAPQVWIVFTGEAITSGTAITSVVNYALNGRYLSPKLTPTYNTVVSANHNIGTDLVDSTAVLYAKAAVGMYVIGDKIYDWMQYTTAAGYAYTGTKPSCSNKLARLKITDSQIVIPVATGNSTQIGTTSIATTFDIQFMVQRSF